MKIILAFDKFKGSMTSREAAEAAEKGIRTVYPDAVTVTVPAADGGEGTTDAFLSALGGKTIKCNVTHTYIGKDMCTVTRNEAVYGILPDGSCVMEMAAASGLELVEQSLRNPLYTTTYGTGEMIRDALDRGCRRFLIGIGGSATNDGGCGMAAALGAVFYDALGNTVPYPAGASLESIARIDGSRMDERLKNCTFIVCCDVDNPLCGETGAARVFAPQKGADAAAVDMLDRGLAHIAELMIRDLKIRDLGAAEDLAEMPGAGAAGGMGAGMTAFLHACLTPGAEAVMDAAGIDDALRGADLLLTGEGKLDLQTVHGKTVAGFLGRANRADVPVIAFGGCVTPDAEALYDAGIAGLYALCDGPMTVEESMRNAPELLKRRVRSVMETWKRAGR